MDLACATPKKHIFGDAKFKFEPMLISKKHTRENKRQVKFLNYIYRILIELLKLSNFKKLNLSLSLEIKLIQFNHKVSTF